MPESPLPEWTLQHCPPHLPWDERHLLSTRPADDSPSASLRILLVGVSHDLELANLARRLSHTPATVRVLLVDQLATLPEWRTAAPAETFDVGYCRAYRTDRPVHYYFDQSLRQSESWGLVDPSARRYAAEQVDTLFWALMARHRVARWINSPWQIRASENKLTQLDVAADCGFHVPRTLVTSRGDVVRDFVAESPEGAVSKSLDSPVLLPGEPRTPFRYTTPVRSAELSDSPFPQLFQQRVLPDEELRVTVVGRQIFAATVRPGDAAEAADWRSSADNHAAFEATLLSDQDREQITEVMRRLDLQVGGIDLLRNAEGTYFLEVNPSCAFLWLERSLEIEITGALMRLLLTPQL